MVVLSLFNGMSCGYMALQEAGIPVTKYYSSEVDKHAVNMSSILYPETIQLGDVRNIDVSKLDKIDILIGGSPCQSFSFAGKMKGMSTKCEKEVLSLEQYLELKEQNFEFEGQSYLFWEYVRIYTELKKINPDIKFLLENVLMVEKWERIISKTLDVNPIMINSALVSAQNRKRLYWTNIGMQPSGLFGEMASIIKQPEDKGILLKDILEENVPEKYYLSDKALKYLEKDTTNGWSDRLSMLNYDDKDKAGCITANHSKGVPYNMIKCVAMRGRNPENPKSRESGTGCIKFGRTDEAKKIRKENMQKGIDYTPFAEKTIVDIDFEKMNTLTTSTSKDNLVMQINERQKMNLKSLDEKANSFLSTSYKGSQANGMTLVITEATQKGYVEIEPGECFDAENPNSETRRGRKMSEKSNCLMAKETDFMHYTTDYRIRRLTPRECGRLQTVPEHLLDKMLSSGISDTQLYKMFGNGWTVSVIAHIFSYLIPYQKE